MRFFHHNYEFTIQWSVAFSGCRTTYSKSIGLFVCLFVCKLDHFIERLFFFVQLFRVNTVIIIAIIECFFFHLLCRMAACFIENKQPTQTRRPLVAAVASIIAVTEFQYWHIYRKKTNA